MPITRHQKTDLLCNVAPLCLSGKKQNNKIKTTANNSTKKSLLYSWFLALKSQKK